MSSISIAMPKYAGDAERPLQRAHAREEIGLEYLMCAPLSHESFTLFTERVLPKLG